VPRHEGRGSFGQKTVSAMTLVLSLLAGMALASAGAYLWRRNNPAPDDATSLHDDPAPTR
jgi:hypothetical protein